MRVSTGRVVPPVQAVGLVVEAFWTWYKRNWRASVVSSVVQPVLFLVALGLGFGSQVQAGPATLGLPYVQYLAPALLAASAMQIAVAESTYPVLSSFKWQRNYLAVVATPITPTVLVSAQLLWIAIRVLTSGAAFLAVAALLGALDGAAVLLVLPVALLTGMAMSAPIVAYAATIETEGQQFNFIFRFVVMPMMMFAGTFFPVEQLPAWIQPLVWATPLWHGTELARGVSFGGLDPLPFLGHTAFLLACALVGFHFCKRNFARRLAV